MTHCRVRVPLIAALLLGAGAFAAGPPSPFTSHEEYGAFLQGYYKNPQPERIEAAIRFVAGSDVMTNDRTDLLTQAAFSYLFAHYPDRKPAFKQSITSLDEPARAYFQKAVDSNPADLFLQVPPQPKKNDKVHEALELAAKGKNKVVAAAARDALQESPDAIQAATIDVIKAQKAAGVWK